MRDLFQAYYRKTPSELKELWANAAIVLDANVLLNLYRYPTDARNDLINLLKSLSSKIWIPYQVALEYQVNRPAVIAAQKKRFNEVRKVISDVQGQLNAEFGKLQLQKRHSVIRPEKLLNDVGALFQSFLKDLEPFEAQQLDVLDEDSIRSSLDDLLKDQIGPRPTQNELDAICGEGKERFANRMPPGFEDDSKQNDKNPFQFSNGLKIERRFGDLIVWKQAIALAKANQFRFLIFVTDDEKSDWWWKIDSGGPKTLGPRPELMEEIRRDGGVENFTIYSSESFMVAAKEYLGLDISQSSIEQIGDIQQEIRQQRNVPLSKSLPKAVFNWLQQEMHPDEIVVENPGFPEFTIHTPTGTHGYEAKTISRRVLNELAADVFRRHEKLTELDQMNYILLARSADKLVELKLIFGARKFSIPENALIIFGYLQFDGSYSTPVLRIDSCYDGLRQQWILGSEQTPEPKLEQIR